MAQSLAQVYIHIVFSTKYREPLIDRNIDESLYAYIGGIVKEMKGIPIAINGIEDHIHILTTLPRTITIAKYVEEIKRGSSRWMSSQGKRYISFSWQRGYGIFSVSSYKVCVVKKYIENQKIHHAKQGFKDELKLFLNTYKIEYDEKYLWSE